MEVDMSCFRFLAAVAIACLVSAAACSRASEPTGPSSIVLSSSGSPGTAVTHSTVGSRAEQPPFNLEAILRGEGFGLVKFRQVRDPTQNIIDLDVWVRDLHPNTSYSLQRATDATLDDVCTGTNWLTLGQGPVPQPIVTDDTGTGRASLWRDLSFLSPGTAFDIHFRVIQSGTALVALQSDCYRFVVRD
jgi:hypothetical protein